MGSVTPREEVGETSSDKVDVHPFKGHVHVEREGLFPLRISLWGRAEGLLWRTIHRLTFPVFVQLQSMALTWSTITLLALGQFWNAVFLNLSWSVIVTQHYEWELGHGQPDLMEERARSENEVVRGFVWYTVGWKQMLYAKTYNLLCRRPRQSWQVKLLRKSLILVALFVFGFVPLHYMLTKEGFSKRVVYWIDVMGRVPNSALAVLQTAGSVFAIGWIFWLFVGVIRSQISF